MPPRRFAGIAVSAALGFCVAATLWLGITPGMALHAAQNGAHTLQPPPAQAEPSALFPTVEIQPQSTR